MNKSFILVLTILVCIPVGYTFALQPDTAELSRSSTSDVVADDKGIISLNPNDEFELIQLNNRGELTIEPNNLFSEADSMNRNSVLRIGNLLSPSENPAFTVTNLTGTNQQITFSVESTQSNTTGSEAIQYVIEQQDGSITSISIDESETLTVDPGNDISVSIEIDSTGLTSTDEIDTRLLITGDSNE